MPAEKRDRESQMSHLLAFFGLPDLLDGFCQCGQTIAIILSYRSLFIGKKLDGRSTAVFGGLPS